jgi:glycosyltransferase involved in cell wall biosynthesis
MTKNQPISFIIPCRNNLPYLKQAINSIEKHYGTYHHIIILDDASDDGTWEWILSISERPNIKKYRNTKSDRVGHTVLYDIGISLADTPIVTILHSDMVVTENYVANMLKHLKPMTVVSGTRIEPPLHPPGPEKYVMNFGLEVDEFSAKEEAFTHFVATLETQNEGLVTYGIFAPWMLYKEDFASIGGHDLLFAPMELEDSDIFNRMDLAGYKLVQSRDAFVYHMTCRGSRFKDGIEIEREIPLPDGTIWYKPKDSVEYTKLRENKFREWWRKWHTNVLHDDNMLPIVPKRYHTTFVIVNCTPQLLSILEPWCDRIYVDCEYDSYIQNESKETMFDISEKVYSVNDELFGDVVVRFDGSKLTQEHYQQFIMNLPFVIQQNDSVGTFDWDIFEIEIYKLTTKDMIKPLFKNVF